MSMPSIADGQVFTSYPAQYSRSENETSETKKRLDSLAFFPSHVLISFELKINPSGSLEKNLQIK